MAIICYEVDNLILHKLAIGDICNLIQTNKYWQKRMGWLIEDYRKASKRSYGPYTIFSEACRMNFLRLAQWLWENSNCSISMRCIEMGFLYSCKNGYLETAKWLLKIYPDIDIRWQDDHAFCLACIYGRLEIVKWLWVKSNHTINLHTNGNLPFAEACAGKKLTIVLWLWNKFKEINKPIDIEYFTTDTWICIVQSFPWLCSNGLFEIAKWAYDQTERTGYFDLYGENHGAFSGACKNGHLEIVKWLCQIEPRYRYQISDTIDCYIDSNLI